MEHNTHNVVTKRNPRCRMLLDKLAVSHFIEKLLGFRTP